MIIDIRGTNGAGKSTLVTHLNLAAPFQSQNGTWVTPVGGPHAGARAIGRYLTPCGGCDGVKTMDLITAAAYHQHSLGYTTIIEGAIIGTIFQRFDRLAERVWNEYVLIFLTTPIEKCTDQVRGRREHSGNTKPFDPNRSLIPRAKSIDRARVKFEAAGRHVVQASFDEALELVKELIDISDWSETRFGAAR